MNFSVGRLAPTPSGHLHLGNVLAFTAAWLSVRRQGGRLLLRMEDLDRGRAREAVAQGQREDLLWLGLNWDQEVLPQSQRSYSTEGLAAYYCHCPRSQRAQCTCRFQHHTTGALRFRCGEGLVRFKDRAWGAQSFLPEEDPIILRANGEAAYPLAVVVDDARDGVSEVVRGGDLLSATAVQIQIHQALQLKPPSYLHVPVLYGQDGKKLSKSHGSTEIRALRAAGWSPEQIWNLLLPLLGTQPPLETASLQYTGWHPAYTVVEEGHNIRIMPQEG